MGMTSPKSHMSRETLILLLAARSVLSCRPSNDDAANPAESHLEMGAVALGSTQFTQSPGFEFLPPVAPRRFPESDSLPDLPITVRIDELTDGKVSRSVATFTPGHGPDGRELRFHAKGIKDNRDDGDSGAAAGSYYYAHWDIDSHSATSSVWYRVSVFVPDKSETLRELGSAQLGPSIAAHEGSVGSPLEPSGLGIPIRLHLRFRVTWQAVDQDHDGILNWHDNCPTVTNPNQTDSVGNGVGDACRCARVQCLPTDPCHRRGECEPSTGVCSAPPARDGNACIMPNALAVCSGGTCQVVTCVPGYADCDGDPADGCETSLTTVNDCGGCGIRCASGQSSTAVCYRGRCRLHCDRGYADCDREASTGCERNVLGDADNCGSCGRVCEEHKGCRHGVCDPAICQADYADCNGNPGDGCETDQSRDRENCGTCGRTCLGEHALATCIDGECRVASCEASYADCNGDFNDGCEVDLTSDADHCGSCESPCALPNASAACVRGSCVVAQCAPGFANCDGDVANGCEANLITDADNCGACAHACVAPNATPACEQGQCVVSACNLGSMDCDGNPGNGCEALLSNDRFNCGACGQACASAKPLCVEGVCVACVGEGGCATCLVSTNADCDGNPNNWCETDLLSDPNHCGACATHCTTPYCQGGICHSNNCPGPFCPH
jgi:hypothetical protein